MVEFSRFYINFIKELLNNIGNFFKAVFKAIADFFYNDLKGYIHSFLVSLKNFEIVDWIIAILVLLINLVFIIFLVIRLVQILRRYIHFSKREVEKDELLEEISLLNQKTMELIEEKNKILAMKVSNLGLTPGQYDEEEDGDEDSDEKKPEIESRFSKLIEVDQEYENIVTSVQMKPEDMISLENLVERFINYSASQLKLFYNKQIISAFFAGMATSKIIILEGISGTGKTSLPYAMGKFFNHDASIISVQPAWRDRTELIGYLNEFTKKFNESDFLRALYEATFREDLSFIILDEMNLARIEYYFAEFLSIMEMPNPQEWKIEVVSTDVEGDPIKLKNGKLTVPQNLWFIGTANRDDSTFTITDKVYDRATPIVINAKAAFIDAPMTDSIVMSFEYLDSLFKAAEKDFPVSPKTADNLSKLDLFITGKFNVTFGNRIMKQLKQFIPIYVACGRTEIEGLDYLVANKIIRKFESLNLSFLHEEIDELIVLMDKLFGKSEFISSISALEDLKKIR
ncbi:MAG: hypothetical protein PHX62_07565 [Bacilli bacterium]|nr:hypothetical protein [Bacilli bacterium]